MRCWYTRWQMSNSLERGDLAARMARGHAAGCAACQSFGRSLASLHARLSRGAHAAAVPVVPARRAPRRLLIAAPLVACAATVAAVVALGPGRPEPVAVAPPAPSPVAPPAPALRVTGVADRVAQLFARTPLENELDALIRDGRRGLDAVLATGGLSAAISDATDPR